MKPRKKTFAFDYFSVMIIIIVLSFAYLWEANKLSSIPGEELVAQLIELPTTLIHFTLFIRTTSLKVLLFLRKNVQLPVRLSCTTSLL